MSAVLPAVDWHVTSGVGKRLVGGSRDLTDDDLRAAVADLHDAADRAIDLVADATGLGIRAKPPVFAVDRPTWVHANAQLAAALFRRVEPAQPPTLRRKVSGRANALVLAGGLAVFGRRIIGQYDPFTPGGRLLLVVPNVLETERRLGLVPADFRLWATLHEQTHAVQFGAAGWLPGHIADLLRVVAADGGATFGSLTAGDDGSGAVDRLMAIMSLLEGHADVMMDIAGGEVVATWPKLRATFDAARVGRRSDLMGLLGVVSKADQYRNGAEFCRRVLGTAGVGALNVAFSRAELLPRLGEIADPDAWLARVHGQA